MPRLCVHCGYDVSGTPVEKGGRRCPECGEYGRGVRPLAWSVLLSVVIWRAIQAFWRFEGKFIAGMVCCGVAGRWHGGRWGDFMASAGVLLGLVLLAWAVISGFRGLIAAVRSVGALLPPQRRRLAMFAVGLLTLLLDGLGAIVGLIVLGLTSM